MTLRAVIFDMDGVLADSVEAHFRSWQVVCAEYGLPFDRRVNEKLLGLTRRSSLEVILNGREWSEEQFREILKKKNEIFLANVRQMSAADLLPGVRALLDELQAAGLRVGVASASRNARAVLSQLEIDRYLHAIVDGSNVRSKPAPDIYRRAAEKLGVAPADCLAVDDSQAGVEAGLAAGMCVLGIGPARRLGAAHAVYKSLDGVHLKDLNAVYRVWKHLQHEARISSTPENSASTF